MESSDPFDPQLPHPNANDALITSSLGDSRDSGRVLGFSRGAQALFGWREREILGRPVSELLHEKHCAIDAQTVAEASRGHCVRDTIVKCVRRDGSVLACLQTLLPMRDLTGRVSSVLRIVFDLTSLREAERAMRRMLAQVHELARDAAVRPASGSELAREVRRECDRTREQFLRIVAGETEALVSGPCGELAAALAAARRAEEVERVLA